MSHEPECLIHTEDGCMGPVALAYQRGREAGKATVHDCGQHSMACCTAGYNRGYREGYNDHARSRAYAEQVYGPYLSKTAAERLALWDRPDAVFNQHGKGENP